MKVIGTTKLRLMAPGGGWTTTVALVCPKLSHQYLMSWVTQKKLQMLHPGWPFFWIWGQTQPQLQSSQQLPKVCGPDTLNQNHKHQYGQKN